MRKKMSTAEPVNDAHKQHTLQSIWKLVFHKTNFFSHGLTS